MKKLLFITLTILCSCGPDDYNKLPTIYSSEGMDDLKTYTIDSCEYIGKLRGFESDVLTHKGNCKFCAERNKNSKIKDKS